MKRFLCVIQCILLSMVVPVCSAETNQTCEAKSKQVSADKREGYIKSCLAEASSPEHIKAVVAQEKHARCEQNAKNMKLEGGRKADYLNDCFSKNEAANEARKVNANAPVLARAEHTTLPRTTTQAKPQVAAVKAPPARHAKPSCLKQAQQEGLKGDARKKFMNECRKA